MLLLSLLLLCCFNTTEAKKDNWPPQWLGELEPLATVVVPIGHVIQLVCCALSWYVSRGQSWQFGPRPSAEIFPAGHGAKTKQKLAVSLRFHNSSKMPKEKFRNDPSFFYSETVLYTLILKVRSLNQPQSPLYRNFYYKIFNTMDPKVETFKRFNVLTLKSLLCRSNLSMRIILPQQLYLLLKQLTFAFLCRSCSWQWWSTRGTLLRALHLALLVIVSSRGTWATIVLRGFVRARRTFSCGRVF